MVSFLALTIVKAIYANIRIVGSTAIKILLKISSTLKYKDFVVLLKTSEQESNV